MSLKISYTTQQLAKAIWCEMHYTPNLEQKIGETRIKVYGAANHGLPPTPPILAYFGLQQEGELYVWQPK